MNQDTTTVIISGDTLTEEDGEHGEETIIAYTEHNPDMGDSETMHDLEQDNEDLEEEEEEEDEEIHYNMRSVPFQKQFRKFGAGSLMKQDPSVQHQKTPLSTHVIDSTRGSAVSGLQVTLYKLIDGRWTYINEGSTGTDGRVGQFMDMTTFTPGRYKLHYDVDRYFEARKVETLYPFIEIVLDCKSCIENYHVAVVISPFGYSTYRGS